MIKYVLMVSEYFPKTHKKIGATTGFIQNNKLSEYKIHTLRSNYTLWKTRFKKIDAGEAYISIRIWSGKPYASKQILIKRLDRSDGIGLQKVEFLNNNIESMIIDRGLKHAEMVSQNDGLVFDDFKEWFKKSNLNEPMAMIHFTPFRY